MIRIVRHRNLLIAALMFGLNAPVSSQADAPAGFDLPIVDLDAREDLRTVVDREKGQYLGHPTTLLLRDGRTILCVYRKGHGSGAVVYKRSKDGGKTWSERLPTPKSWATSKEVPTLYETVDATGSRRVLMFSGHQNRYRPGPPNRMAVSDDGGLTWGELEPIPNQIGRSVVMSDLIAVKDTPGHYMASYHMDWPIDSVRTYLLYTCFTEDGGLTWSDPVTIHSSQDDDLALCEGGFVRDGSTIAVLLRENSRTAPSQIMFTRDEGRTWTKPRPLPRALWGDRHQVVTLRDGRLLIQFRDFTPRRRKGNRSSPTEGDWAGWVGTFEDLVHGRKGQYRIRVRDNHHDWDCAYPAIEQLPDGTLVSTTYGSWDAGESPYILSYRFTIDQLDALAKRINTTGQPAVRNYFRGKMNLYTGHARPGR